MQRQVTTYPYSSNVCRLECFGQQLVAECNCIPSMPPEWRVSPEDEVCASPELVACKENVSRKEQKYPGACVNSCLPRCNWWKYQFTMTTAKFPSKALLRTNRSNWDIDWNGRKDDLILLEVVFEDLEVRNNKYEKHRIVKMQVSCKKVTLLTAD